MSDNKDGVPCWETEMDFDFVRIPAQTHWALGVLIEYLWNDEQKAYHELEPMERRGHIYEVLNHVRVWRNGPIAKLRAKSERLPVCPLNHLRSAAKALLCSWDELRKAEILLNSEIDDEGFRLLVSGLDTGADAERVSDEVLMELVRRKGDESLNHAEAEEE